MSLDEAQLYNLHNSSYSASEAAHEAKHFAFVSLVNHMHEDHGMTVRQLAKRFKVKEKEVKAFLFKEQ